MAEQEAKGVLSIKEMSRISNYSESYIKNLMKTGRLNPNQVAVPVDVPIGGQAKEFADARERGAQINIKTQPQSAEETFRNFLDQPIGRARLSDPRCITEATNEAKGLPHWFRGDPNSPSEIREAMQIQEREQDGAGKKGR